MPVSLPPEQRSATHRTPGQTPNPVSSGTGGPPSRRALTPAVVAKRIAETQAARLAAENPQQGTAPPDASDSVFSLSADEIIAIVEEIGDLVTALRDAEPEHNSTSTATSAYASPTTQKHERCGQVSILPRTVGIWFVSGDQHKPMPNGQPAYLRSFPCRSEPGTCPTWRFRAHTIHSVSCSAHASATRRGTRRRSRIDPVPAQHCRGRDLERGPSLTGQPMRQHGQHEPVLRGVSRPGHLPAQHHQLMPQHRDLDVF